MNEFGKYHPIVSFVYYAAVIGFSMVFMNPVCLVISFASGAVYSVMLGGPKTVRLSPLVLLPLMAAAAVINPLINHEGMTILGYLPSGNPLTLESIAYGAAAAVMLAAVICQFSCFGRIVTSDKFIYLFGRIIPSLSLVLSMVLRFVPRFREQIREVSEARACIGKSAADGGIIKRAKNGVKILSVMITRSLENSIETADSMKSRGFGLRGRTAFSNFRFEKRDARMLALILFLIVYILPGNTFGGLYFRYFPDIDGARFSLCSVSTAAAYFLLFALPIIVEIKEELHWKKLKSKI